MAVQYKHLFPLIFKVGHKRVFGVIMAAFTAFNNIADFMGRCNNVVGWFDNINRFMGTGGSQGGSQITLEHLNDIKQQIEGLADQVNGEFKEMARKKMFLGM